MRQRDVAALDAKYTKELADAKAENDAHAMMLPLVVVGCNIKAVCQSVREATTLSGVDNAASPDWVTPPIPIISHPQREADHYAKTTEGTQKYINASVDRVAHIDGQLMQLLWAIHTALPAEYKCLK